MSRALEDLARAYRGTPSARAVLKELAFRANRLTARCIPSIRKLCADTGLSDKTVRAALKRLCGEGLIERHDRRREDGSRTSDGFTVNVAALRALARTSGEGISGAGRPQNWEDPLEEVPGLTSFGPVTEESGVADAPPDSEKRVRGALIDLTNVTPIGELDARRLQRLLETAAAAPMRPPDELRQVLGGPRARAGPPRSRLPHGWTPTPDDLAMAEALGLTPEETHDATAQFRDRWTSLRGAGAYRADWSTEWRGWVRIFAGLLRRGRSGVAAAGGCRQASSFAALYARRYGYDQG